MRITIEPNPKHSDNLIELAKHVLDNLTREEIDEVERIALDRRKFFHDRTAS